MTKTKVTKIVSFTLAIAMLIAGAAAIPISASQPFPPKAEVSFPGCFWLDVDVGLSYASWMSLDYDSLGEGNYVYFPEPAFATDFGEIWYIQPESNGYYSIRPVSCMDAALSVENDSSANGARITIKKYVASVGQAWKLEYDADNSGYYQILSKSSYYEKGLTVSSIDSKTVVTQTDSPSFFCLSDPVYSLDHTHTYQNRRCTNCGKLLGDLNDDDKVTPEDVTLIEKHLAKWSDLLINLSVADMNEDGVVNATDAVLLRRYVHWDLGYK